MTRHHTGTCRCGTYGNLLDGICIPCQRESRDERTVRRTEMHQKRRGGDRQVPQVPYELPLGMRTQQEPLLRETRVKMGGKT